MLAPPVSLQTDVATRKVLVVDDEKRILTSLEDLLEEEFTVLTAGGAGEGLALLEQHADTVAVILCDQRMPGMNGDEFLTRARNLSEATRILITGYADLQALMKAVNHGQIYGYIAKPWDPLELEITVRKAADHFELVRALKESEERFRNVFDNAPIGLALVGTDSRFIRVNKGICRMLGYTEAELQALTYADVLHPEERADEGKDANEIISGTRPTLHVEKRFLKKTGEVLWADVTATRLTDRLTFGLAMLVNITERKAAEEARQRMVEVLEATPDLVSIFDQDGKRLYLNRAGRRMLGVGEGQDVSNIRVRDAHPERESDLMDRAMALAKEEGSWVGETTLVDRDGNETPVSQVIVAHKNEDGELLFVSSSCRDIRDIKSLEEQARQSQKMEAIGRLAGGVAHDFNNLLTAISGYAQFLEPELADNEAASSDLKEIQKAADRAASLTRQLLAFSRRQVLNSKVLSLNSVVADMHKMLRRLIGEDIELVTVLQEDLANVRADPSQMEQVVMNLAVNARDAMPGGGRLVIETANVTIDSDILSDLPGARPGRYVMLSVSDTGMGMDEATRFRIFEPFFTTKEKGKGTGLGLSTVYGIAKQSDGYIYADSESGKGTTFRMYLPPVEEPQAAEHDTPELAQKSGSETILLVEDEDTVRELARRVLERSGYRVLLARNGNEALELCGSHRGPVHLMLTDITMPQMSGPELAREAASRFPGLKIAYISGYSEANTKELPGPYGDLLGKPFTAEALIAKVREVLDRDD